MNLQLGRYLFIVIASLSLLSCASPKMSQEMQAGKMAFESGYYKDAFRRLLPIAVKGNCEAQYAVGYMYYYGYGVPQDNESGLFWIDKSAEQNYPPARMASNLIHQHELDAAKAEKQQLQRDTREEILQSTRIQRERAAPIVITPRRLKKTSLSEEERTRFTEKTEFETVVAENPQPVIEAEKPQAVPETKAVVSSEEPRKFTLQLYGSYHLPAVQTVQKELRLKNTGHIYQTSHNGRDWYILTFGRFVTNHEATATKSNLPKNLKTLEPWVRNVDALPRLV
jgi:DamX protein